MHANFVVSFLSVTLWAVLLPGATSSHDSGSRSAVHARLVQDHLNARKYVESRWEAFTDEPLPCKRAQKVGQILQKSTYTQSKTLRPTQMDMKVYEENLLPVYASCNVLISHKYKFIYLRMLKSASSTTLRSFYKHFCSNEQETINLSKCKPEELQILSVGPNSQPDDIDRWWQEYFVFTIVRNPWTRLSSAYFMFTEGGLLRRKGSDGTPGEHCGLPFEDVSRKANLMGGLCDTEQCCTYTDTHGTAEWKPLAPIAHVHDQSHCAFDVQGRPLADFIGTAENFDNDFAVILDEIRRRSGFNVTVPQVEANNLRVAHTGNGHTPGTECTMDLHPHLDAATMKNIALQYALDIVRFGYLEAYVPP